MTTDMPLADKLYERLASFIPQVVTFDGEEWVPYGLNCCWRLSKYFPGDRFQRHCDTNFVRNKDEQSFLTVNAYMNGDFEGGRTRFYAGYHDEVAAVKGETGDCVLFLQPPVASLYHDGEEVSGGVKYLFRSDVMFRRAAAAAKSGADEVGSWPCLECTVANSDRDWKCIMCGAVSPAAAAPPRPGAGL